MKMAGIYVIRNRINNKVYVGQSFDLRSRWVSHKSKLRKGTHRNKHLQNAWNTYYEENFDYIILKHLWIEELNISEAKELLKQQEENFMKLFKSGDHTYCYNEMSALQNSTYKLSLPKNNPKCSKIILQYDLQGNLLKEYPSASEASRQTGIPNTTILDRATGLVKYNTKRSIKNNSYIWIFKKGPISQKLDTIPVHFRPILQFNKKGIFIKEWEGVAEFIKSNSNFNTQILLLHCKGKGCTKSLRGFQFKFKNSEKQIQSLYKQPT